MCTYACVHVRMQDVHVRMHMRMQDVHVRMRMRMHVHALSHGGASARWSCGRSACAQSLRKAP